MLIKKFGVVIANFLGLANTESSYPNLENFEYFNYASKQQEQVVYDYVDYDYQNNYNDDNRYRVEEATKDYDYSKRNYKVVEEGSTGTYKEKSDWSYDPNSYFD